ncbi:MAG: gamma carbonic anhydrase family protein [Acidobacteriota bacterium]
MNDATLLPFGEHRPVLAEDVYLAPGARLLGDVTLGPGVSIWCNAVLRADLAPIEIGAGSNVQDNCVFHVDIDLPCRVGRDVVVGHGAVVHGCEVGDGCLIAMNAVVLSGARIGDGSVVGAGAVVPEGREIPPGKLVLGAGAKIVKDLPEGFAASIAEGAARYRELAAQYRREAEQGGAA